MIEVQRLDEHYRATGNREQSNAAVPRDHFNEQVDRQEDVALLERSRDRGV